MAPIKRKRQHGDFHGHFRKKQRFEERGEVDLDQDSVPQAVSLEKASWHEVPFPKTFEDAEGFFGLEELSDVEVIRDSGNIEYRVHLASLSTERRRLMYI